MIITAGMRTDIPAFYSEWFLNRIREGSVLVRNPYRPEAVTRYELNPEVVDALVFCTKNPTPMLPHLQELQAYRQFWYITLTPYGKDIEPNVPDKKLIVEQFKELSIAVNFHNATLAGIANSLLSKSSSVTAPESFNENTTSKIIRKLDAVHWRYAPVLITEKYSVEQHIKSFSVMAELLAGYTHTCVISFVDVYNNVKKNFPELRPVTPEEEIALTKAFVEIGRKYDIAIKTCLENSRLAEYGADISGCGTADTLAKALGLSAQGLTLEPPKKKFARPACSNCIISGDIGAYSNCPHLCRYCYANHDKGQVLRNHKLHDPASQFIVGNSKPDDIIHQAKQERWIKPIAEKPSHQPDLFEI